MSNQKEYIIFLFFMAVAVGLRFFSFFPSVLDHDESTYLIIGRDILNGKMLYTDVTDTKPVGIFLFYAGLEFIFGNSIFWKRLVMALVVGATAFLIFRGSKKLFSNNKVAFASGLIYIFYTSIWNYHGRSPNTELLFNLFTIAALIFFFKKNYLNYFFGGLALGIGFIVKYLVLFDFMAFMLFFFMVEMLQLKSNSSWSVFSRYVLSGLAFTIPFIMVNLYFWQSSNFDDFYYITYELPGNYGSNPSAIRYFVMLADFIAKFLPISFVVFYVIFKKHNLLEKKHKWFFILWIALVLFAIYIPGKEFSHYTIQLMLPFSLLAGLFFHPNLTIDRFTSSVYNKKTGYIILGILLLVIQAINFNDDILKPDYPREIAQVIAEEIEPAERVYVSNYHQIIYYLLDQASPTKFIHSNLLFTSTHLAFKINAKDEIRRIMDTRPEFVVVQNHNVQMKTFLGSEYQVIRQFRNGGIQLYKLVN